MIKKMLNYKVCNLLATVALVASTLSADGCAFIFHQEKLPEEVKKLRKY